MCKISLFFIALLIFLGVGFNDAQADVIFPGQKVIEVCYNITNFDDYNEYTFMFWDAEIITDGSCVNEPYAWLGTAMMYAIETSKFDKSAIEAIPIEDLSDYFQDNQDFIPTAYLFDEPTKIDEQDPAESVEILLSIEDITSSELVLREGEITATHTDGTQQVDKGKGIVRSNTALNPVGTDSKALDIIIAVALTIVLEFLVLLAFLRKSPLKLLGIIVLINVVTVPIANLMYTAFGQLLLIELAVFAVEIPFIALLAKTKWVKAILISLVANGLTAAVGLLIAYILLNGF
ncbi:hypothetical protein ACFL2D_02855 [Patescibacteria group bacterium]